MQPVTETELKEKAVAPRVTLEGLEANIAASYTFNVLKVLMNNNVFQSEEQVPLMPVLGTLTMCVIVLKNGFTVTGQSACADPENYNKEIGDRLAYNDAKQKIWAFMGYALKEEVYLNGDGTFIGRLKREAKELEGRLNKAQAFIGTDTFNGLGFEERELLITQKNIMVDYLDTLRTRLSLLEAK